MRIVLQRVKHASVTINGRVVGQIGPGVLILLGVHASDTSDAADFLAQKCADLRIFDDDQGKMNRSLLDVKGEALVVSQFTLYADTSHGRRPSYIEAARPEIAVPLYEHFVAALRKLVPKVETGEFGAMMDVALVNDGPVTLVLERSREVRSAE
jgi:D-tyrosyl-tRNA(Tyr) deacylase